MTIEASVLKGETKVPNSLVQGKVEETSASRTVLEKKVEHGRAQAMPNVHLQLGNHILGSYELLGFKLALHRGFLKSRVALVTLNPQPAALTNLEAGPTMSMTKTHGPK